MDVKFEKVFSLVLGGLLVVLGAIAAAQSPAEEERRKK